MHFSPSVHTWCKTFLWYLQCSHHFPAGKCIIWRSMFWIFPPDLQRSCRSIFHISDILQLWLEQNSTYFGQQPKNYFGDTGFAQICQFPTKMSVSQFCKSRGLTEIPVTILTLSLLFWQSCLPQFTNLTFADNLSHRFVILWLFQHVQHLSKNPEHDKIGSSVLVQHPGCARAFR